MFASGVLTSEEIQRNYFKAIKRSRLVTSDYPYLLVEQPKGREGKSSWPAPAPPVEQPPVEVVPEATEEAPAPMPPIAGHTYGRTSYTVSYDDEVDRMKADQMWLEAVQYNRGVTEEYLLGMLDKYLGHCREYQPTHLSFNDAKRHFLNWLYKQPKPVADNPPDHADYSVGDFGSLDI